MHCMQRATAILLATMVLQSAQAADPVMPSAWPVAEHEALFRPLGLTTADTQKLVDALASPDFQTREAASRELKQNGINAYPGLRERYASDPELQARLQNFVEGREIVVPPIVKKVSSSVQRYLQNRDAYLKLTRADAALVKGPSGSTSLAQRIIRDMNLPIRRDLVAETLGLIERHEGDPNLRQALDMCHRLVADADARILIAAGKIPQAEDRLRSALDLQMPMRQDYAALVSLRRGTALFDPARELAACDIAGEPREELAMVLFRAKGDFAQAADHAANLRITRDLFPSEILMGDDRFALLTRPVVKPLTDNPYDPNVALALLLTSRPGDESALDARLSRPLATFQNDNPTLRGRTLQLLVQTGRVSQAIDLAKEYPEHKSTAVRLLVAQARVREALQLLDPEDPSGIETVLQLNELGLSEAATQLLRDIKLGKSAVERSTAQYQFDIASEWERRGDFELAASWRELAFASVDASRKRYDEAAAPRQALTKRQSELTSALSGSRDPEIRRQTMAELAQIRSQLNDMRQPMPPLESIRISSDPIAKTSEERAELNFWYTTIAADFPAGMNHERHARTIALLKGQVPPEEVRRLLMASKSPEALAIGGRRLALMGREDLALDLVNQAVEREETPAALAYAGDWAMDNNDPKHAAEYYRRAAAANITDATLMYRLGVALSRLPESKAQGQELIAYVPWLVLSDTRTAMNVAIIMRRLEGAAVSDPWYDNHLAHYQGFNAYDLGHHYDRLRRDAQARGDDAAALAAARRGLFFPAYNSNEESPHYLASLSGFAAYQRARALDANARKDAPTLADALNRHLDNAAPDVALLQKTIPTLKTLDPAAAKSILTRAIDRLQPIAEDYPAAKTYADQLQTLKALQ